MTVEQPVESDHEESTIESTLSLGAPVSRATPLDPVDRERAQVAESVVTLVDDTAAGEPF